jgi:hypothetical protein
VPTAINELPHCVLVQTFAAKASGREDIAFDFVGTLNELRRDVSDEMKYVNVLFDEYTPHDEQYHLRRLFHVADTMLGSTLIAAMNSSELMVLSCALYAHDWGMAVSESERVAIVEDMPVPSGRLIPDEQTRFREFVSARGSSVGAVRRFDAEGESLWREYIRQTHALRSATRVRSYFAPKDGGLAEAVARVCLGHWLPIEDLTDYRSFPPDFSVLRETVNLRAIAAYVRLIDLFDLADDRTPYVIWKFVAPRDPVSRMEWAKHRALQPVTCPAYLDGRLVTVDGSTDDHEVYAALEDLRQYCSNQLTSCLDVLARMNDRRHRLDLVRLEWRVATPTFRPISIRFEFEREAMFRVLSDEIYQGEPQVFLRELLQNSVDAIRMRREVLSQHGVTANSFGRIQVDVGDLVSGIFVVTWADDGIGMDEYVIKNYLAVAGRSYYGSDDFTRQGLKFDPISQFGVGILSCFMVSDRLEIETYREPYLQPLAEPLKITIPSPERQFRVEVRSRLGARVGTTIKVFVNGEAWKGKGTHSHVVDVTEYLRETAAFAEFPISINESGRRTLIAKSSDAARMCALGGVDVVIPYSGFQWETVFQPQDVAIARSVLQEVTFDLAADLGLSGYEGTITFVTPGSSEMDFLSTGRTWPTDEVSVVRRKARDSSPEVLRWISPREMWTNSDDVESPERAERDTALSYAVYRDGIRVSRVRRPTSHRFNGEGLVHQPPPPTISANIAKTRLPRIDLARREILGDERNWFAPILNGVVKRVAETERHRLVSLPMLERSYQLGWMCAFYGLNPGDARTILPDDQLPIVSLDSAGSVAALDLSQVAAGDLFLIPNPLLGAFQQYVNDFVFWGEVDSDLWKRWQGGVCFGLPLSFVTSDESCFAISRMLRMSQLLYETHASGSVRFLSTPSGVPMPQRRLVRVEAPNGLSDPRVILEALAADPTDELLKRFRRTTKSSVWFRPGLQALPFEPPFESLFGYGVKLLNSRNTIVKDIIRVAAFLTNITLSNTKMTANLGRLSDALDRTQFDRVHPDSPVTIDEAIDRLSRLADESRKFNLWRSDASLIQMLSDRDFVPGSINVRDSEDFYFDPSNDAQLRSIVKSNETFGSVIT